MKAANWVIEETVGVNMAPVYLIETSEGDAVANTRSKEVALAIVAIPGLLAALGEIAERAPVPGYGSAGALLLRLVGTQTIARAALGAVKGGVS